MRFLADENVPISVTEELIAASHDVEWVARLTPGILDAEVLRRAGREDRILLTFDKDYGDLAHNSEIAIIPAGIVLIRSPVPRTSEACRALARVIAARETGRDFSASSSPAGFGDGCCRVIDP
jgi:predicted nuclease of predicted toxin-antitoxin system